MSDKSQIVTMLERPDYLYRSGVGIMLLNDNREVFVGKRIDNKSDAWQMPQGGVDDGESEDGAAFRELEEETGIKNAKIIAKSREYYYYNLPYMLQKKFWGGKYLGQKQRWYLMQFMGSESEINLEISKPEFSTYKWIVLNELTKVIVPFKKELYQQVVDEFAEYMCE